MAFTLAMPVHFQHVLNEAELRGEHQPVQWKMGREKKGTKTEHKNRKQSPIHKWIISIRWTCFVSNFSLLNQIMWGIYCLKWQLITMIDCCALCNATRSNTRMKTKHTQTHTDMAQMFVVWWAVTNVLPFFPLFTWYTLFLSSQSITCPGPVSAYPVSACSVYFTFFFFVCYFVALFILNIEQMLF